jgi:hypothetical protein
VKRVKVRQAEKAAAAAADPPRVIAAPVSVSRAR